VQSELSSPLIVKHEHTLDDADGKHITTSEEATGHTVMLKKQMGVADAR
jgi:hypothetical protein